MASTQTTPQTLNKPMTKSHSDDPITLLIAIIFTLITILVRNLTNNPDLWPTSTPTKSGNATAAPKKAAGGTKRAPRSKVSTSVPKQPTTTSKRGTGKTSKTSAKKPRSTTPKVESPSPSPTAQVDITSCPDLTFPLPTLETMTISQSSKTTTPKTTRSKDLITNSI